MSYNIDDEIGQQDKVFTFHETTIYTITAPTEKEARAKLFEWTPEADSPLMQVVDVRDA